MNTRSLKASPDGIEEAERALARRSWTKTNLVTESGLTRSTISKFFSGQPISRENFKSICDLLGLDLTAIAELADPRAETSQLIVPPEDQDTQPQIPDEFRAFIEKIARSFCGREFVFEAFEQFCKEHRNGYFTLVGEPGMGKSAIAAKYVKDHHAICFFNVQAERYNTPDLFLNQMREQLKRRYQLQDAEQANLRKLLQQASERLFGKPLVIVVDALDEVEQQNSIENLLGLPATLPDGIYFLLTRRPYSLETKQLMVLPGTPEGQLDLRAQEYEDSNQKDIEEYFWRGLDGKLPEVVDSVALQQWVKAQHLTPEKFVKELVIKSEKNFMYARYVLPEIAQGDYKNQKLEQLPQGLQNYYLYHWKRMGMDEDVNGYMVIVLFTLVQRGMPTSIKEMAEISEEEEVKVSHILERKWYQFLKEQEREGKTLYSIYHTSFLDFLSSKRELDRGRDLFQAASRKLAKYHQSSTDYYLRRR